jgi:tether containing UBX domain for GLUT4
VEREKTDDFNEADYEFTVDHARQHQARLAQSGRNRRLPSEAERRAHEAAAAERRARVRAVELKIRFPDQTQVVSTFSAADTAAALYAFVRSVLRHADQPFVLTYSSPAGPRIVPGADGGRQMEGKGRGADDGGESTATGGSGGGGGGGGGGGDGGDGSVRLIQDLGFSGRMLINFAWHERASVDARLAASAAGSLLKPEFAAAARELRVEDVKPVVEDSGSGNDASSSSSMNNGPAAANVGGGASSSSSSSKKGIPKWLKLPGKK